MHTFNTVAQLLKGFFTNTQMQQRTCPECNQLSCMDSWFPAVAIHSGDLCTFSLASLASPFHVGVSPSADICLLSLCVRNFPFI